MTTMLARLGELFRAWPGLHLLAGQSHGTSPHRPWQVWRLPAVLGLVRCFLLALALSHLTQKWFLPNSAEKLVPGAFFKDVHGTFPLNLRKLLVFRLLRVLVPRPCFRVPG